jgi:hypothetical protein
MARPRVPLLKAEITGRTKRNPGRFKDRREPPSGGPLGDPPRWVKTPSQIEAWHTLSAELPWLNRSHRAIVSLACEILGRQIAGEEVGVKALSLLRMILGQLGATPSDASKVKMPVEEDEDDPSKKYF